MEAFCAWDAEIVRGGQTQRGRRVHCSRGGGAPRTGLLRVRVDGLEVLEFDLVQNRIERAAEDVLQLGGASAGAW